LHRSGGDQDVQTTEFGAQSFDGCQPLGRTRRAPRRSSPVRSHFASSISA
jgi:hypothetical protein